MTPSIIFLIIIMAYQSILPALLNKSTLAQSDKYVQSQQSASIDISLNLSGQKIQEGNQKDNVKDLDKIMEIFKKDDNKIMKKQINDLSSRKQQLLKQLIEIKESTRFLLEKETKQNSIQLQWSNNQQISKHADNFAISSQQVKKIQQKNPLNWSSRIITPFERNTYHLRTLQKDFYHLNQKRFLNEILSLLAYIVMLTFAFVMIFHLKRIFNHSMLKIYIRQRQFLEHSDLLLPLSQNKLECQFSYKFIRNGSRILDTEWEARVPIELDNRVFFSNGEQKSKNMSDDQLAFFDRSFDLAMSKFQEDKNKVINFIERRLTRKYNNPWIVCMIEKATKISILLLAYENKALVIQNKLYCCVILAYQTSPEFTNYKQYYQNVIVPLTTGCLYNQNAQYVQESEYSKIGTQKILNTISECFNKLNKDNYDNMMLANYYILMLLLRHNLGPGWAVIIVESCNFQLSKYFSLQFRDWYLVKYYGPHNWCYIISHTQFCQS